ARRAVLPTSQTSLLPDAGSIEGRPGGGCLLRIDVDRELGASVEALGRDGLDSAADRRDRGVALRRLHDHLGALPALAPEERRGAEHAGARRVDPLPHLRRGRGLRAGLAGRADDPDQMPERRVAERAPTTVTP